MASAAARSSAPKARSSTTTMNARSGATRSRSPSAIPTIGSEWHLPGRKQGKFRKQSKLLSGVLKHRLQGSRLQASRLPAKNVPRVATHTRPSCRENAHNHSHVLSNTLGLLRNDGSGYGSGFRLRSSSYGGQARPGRRG